jgi:hypothetical protein
MAKRLLSDGSRTSLPFWAAFFKLSERLEHAGSSANKQFKEVAKALVIHSIYLCICMEIWENREFVQENHIEVIHSQFQLYNSILLLSLGLLFHPHSHPNSSLLPSLSRSVTDMTSLLSSVECGW